MECDSDTTVSGGSLPDLDRDTPFTSSPRKVTPTQISQTFGRISPIEERVSNSNSDSFSDAGEISGKCFTIFLS